MGDRGVRKDAVTKSIYIMVYRLKRAKGVVFLSNLPF